MLKRIFAAAAALLALLSLASCLSPGAAAPETAPESEPEAVPEETPLPAPVPTWAPSPPPTPEPDAAEALLRTMSREEKVRQILLLCSNEPEALARAAAEGAGGVCLYADAFAGKDAAAVRAMTDALQAASPIPLLLAVDEEGGTVCRVSCHRLLREVPFRTPRQTYERGGWTLLEAETAEKARLLLSLGLNLNLAPVADLPLGRGNYIYPRSFGTDAGETAEFVRRTVAVMRAEGIGCCLKHFPGYGGSADTHTGQAVDTRDYEAFIQRDFLPFAAGIEAGADAVLVSHNIVTCMDPALPASLSPEVHRILREELGFEGVVLCDELGMEAIRAFTGGEDAAAQAAIAGNDLLCCSDWDGAVGALLQALRDGRLSEEQLDASVLRVLRWKTALGLIA